MQICQRTKEPLPKKAILIDEPIPFSLNDSPHSDQKPLYMIQSASGALLFFTRSSKSNIYETCYLSKSSEELKKREFTLGSELLGPIEHEIDESGKPTERSLLRQRRLFTPMLEEVGNDNTLLAFPQIDAEFENQLHILDAGTNRELAVVRGAQTILSNQSMKKEDESNKISLKVLADPYVNEVLRKHQSGIQRELK